MARLDHLTIDELTALLVDLDDAVPSQRVLAAIACKQGDSTARLAERHGVSQQTIRNWLDRFEDRPLEEAPFDEPRAGRPRKLTDDEYAQLVEELRESSEAVGFGGRSRPTCSPVDRLHQ